MKVLLIAPPNINVIEPFSLSNKLKERVKFIQGFPLGLGYLAAVLKENNIETEILDAQIKDMTIAQIGDFIEDKAPDIVGVNTFTPNIKTAIEIARAAKAVDGSIVTVFGGPHAMHDYNNLLKDYPVDFVVLGEGEYILLELVNALKRNAPLSGIRGIAYKRDGSIFVNTGDIYIENLDSLPYPARELTDFNKYLKHFTHNLSGAVQIMTSRGCPYSCVFCSSGSTFSKWRPRSPENVVGEMKHIINCYPRIKSVSFMDDNFTLQRQRVLDICKLIIKEGLNIYPWDCLSRCSDMDEELLGFMKKAGCVRIQYGIESGCPHILKNIGKRIDLKQVKSIIALTKKAGIEAYAFFMIGNPGETEESIRESIRFAFEIKPAYVNWFVTQVYPGTKLAQMQPQDSWVDYIYEPEVDSPSVYTHPCVPVFTACGLSREFLKNKAAGAMKVFFWRYLPFNFRKWFKKMLRHPVYSLGYLKRVFLG